MNKQIKIDDFEVGYNIPAAIGMDEAEGRALLDELLEWCTQPRFRYLHKWQPKDLVMWDNRVLLHRAVLYDSARYRRVLWRTTVGGAGPVLGPFSREVREARTS